MAITIPTPEAAGLGRVQRSSGAIGNLSESARANTFAGDQLQKLGQTTVQLAGILQDRQDETSLLEAQADWNNKRQEWLNPETGIFSKKNGDAVGAAEGLRVATEDYAKDMRGRYGDLSNDGKHALSRFLEGEQQGLYERAASHELGQSDAYENAMLEAAIGNEANRAVDAQGTPGADQEMAASLLRASGQIDSWLTNQGINPEGDLGASMRRGKLSDHILAVASAQAGLDPRGAEAFVRDNIDSMEQSDANRWIDLNRPKVVAFEGGQAASTARNIDDGASVVDVPIKSNTKVVMNLGPKRPFEPGPEIQNLLALSAEDVLGAGATVEIFSGKDDSETEGANASPRHFSGTAADVRYFRPDGSQVKLGDPEFKKLATAAAGRGALGIGFGEKYMGDAMHVDMFDWKVNPGLFGPAWGQGGDLMETELRTAMDIAQANQGTGKQYTSGSEYIMDIEDPAVRDEAISQYAKAANFKFRQMDQHSQTTAVDLMARADELHAAGEEIDVTAMLGSVQGQLGARIDSTRRYMLAVANDETVQDQEGLFNQLARQASNAASPEAQSDFSGINLRATYAGDLSGSSIEQLEAMQRGILSGTEPIDPNATTVIGSLVMYSHPDVNKITDASIDLLGLKDAAKRTKLSAQLYFGLQNYQQAIFAETGKRPTRVDMETETKRMMNSIQNTVPQFNPAGTQFGRGYNTTFLETLERADEDTLEDLRNADAIVLQYPVGGGEYIKHRVSQTEIDNAIAQWRSIYRLDPAPSQVLTILQQYPPQREEDFNIVE